MYEVGSTPPPGETGSSIGYRELKEQLDRIESKLGSTIPTQSQVGVPVQPKIDLIPSFPLSNTCSSPNFGQEAKLFSAIDSLHTFVIPQPLNAPRTALPNLNTPWPNILIPDQINQTARWTRDMSELLDAIPRTGQLAAMLDYYFREVQGLRACLTEQADGRLVSARSGHQGRGRAI